MLQLSEFVKNLRSSVWDVFNNFLVIDATDRRKISKEIIYRRKPIPPFIFSRALPITQKKNKCERVFEAVISLCD